jgi:hypothetical protein
LRLLFFLLCPFSSDEASSSDVEVKDIDHAEFDHDLPPSPTASVHGESDGDPLVEDTVVDPLVSVNAKDESGDSTAVDDMVGSDKDTDLPPLHSPLTSENLDPFSAVDVPVVPTPSVVPAVPVLPGTLFILYLGCSCFYIFSFFISFYKFDVFAINSHPYGAYCDPSDLDSDTPCAHLAGSGRQRVVVDLERSSADVPFLV